MLATVDKPVVCPALVGRTSDLEALHLHLDQAKDGKGHTVLLSGEAGIGKSRLVDEAKARALALGFLPFQGNCFQPDRSCPYAPLLDLLRAYLIGMGEPIPAEKEALARDLFPLLPEFVPAQASAALPVPNPEHEKRRLFSVLAQFFIRQATRQPVLLIIEDVHWSDDISLEFLHYLARQTTTQRLLVLLTYRSDEVSPDLKHWLAQLDQERLSQECSLTRLTRRDVDVMLRAIFQVQRPIHAAFLDTFFTLTEGNPFFVEEVLKSLTATGEIIDRDGLQDHKPLNDLHIPRSIEDAVQQRSRHLSQRANTRYFLDRCRFPTSMPTIGLLDLNPNSLAATTRRIRRYRPITFLANVLSLLQIDAPLFDSIGLNYLLHCLPGDMRSKSVVFYNLKPLLNAGGVIFGTAMPPLDLSPDEVLTTTRSVRKRLDLTRSVEPALMQECLEKASSASPVA